MIELSVVKRWKKQRLSTLFEENSCKNQGCLKTHALQFFFGTIIPKKSYDLTEDLIRIYEKYIIVSPGDLVLNGLNLNYDFVSQRIGLVKENGIITSAYVILRPRKSVNYAYYCYLFKAMDAKKLFHGMGSGIRLTLSYKDLKNHFLPVPPRDEQDQIVRFLDWKVSGINRLIAVKQKQIATLKEFMQAEIEKQLCAYPVVDTVRLKQLGTFFKGGGFSRDNLVEDEEYPAINKCLADRRSPYKTIIAFSGENKYQGQEPPLTSAGLNGFPDAKIPKEFKKDPYRILIVADMFQTGFDEPLLHTMYVDKVLYDIKAVQTLSRLNRCCPKKYDTFVLDFANKPEMIQESFSRYYRTTILSGETDPNKLYDLVATMEEYQVFSNEDVERLVNLYLDGADRDKLDPALDACTAVYKQFDTDDQIKFKSAAKAFVRTYGFLGAILPYGNADWERLSIFLNLLIPKLPSPREDDLSQGILETIDLESYRNEAREVMSIRLEDTDTEVAPVPAGKVGHIVEPEMDLLSVILSNFNDMFGNINWNDADNVRRQILEIPAMVSKDEKYQNAMRNSDEQSARLESERALQQVIFSIMADNMELFKQFQDNPSFKKWLSDLVFNLTYNKDGKPYEAPNSNIVPREN